MLLLKSEPFNHFFLIVPIGDVMTIAPAHEVALQGPNLFGKK